MGITATNEQLERVMMSFPEVFKNRNIPVKLMYWLSRLQSDIEVHFKRFVETRTKLYEKYCERDVKDNVIYGEKGDFKFPSAVRNQVVTDVDSLRAIVVPIAEYNRLKINISDPQLKGIINSNDMVTLMPFVDFDEPVVSESK